VAGADRSRHRILRHSEPRVRALSGGRGHRPQPHQDQKPANQWYLRALPSHRPRRILPDRLPQEDLTDDRRVADRPRHLARRLQPAATASGPMVLRQDSDAGPSSRNPTREGETHGRLTTDDSSTDSISPTASVRPSLDYYTSALFGVPYPRSDR